MDKWEYRAQFLRADIDVPGARDYAAKKHPDLKPRRFSPIAMSMFLDQYGEEGWELMHIEPIPMLGAQGDVGFAHAGYGGALRDISWSSIYFCVFKRRKAE